MRLLYFAPFAFGGLADYAREQAAALGRRGIEVDLLCPPGLSTPPDAPFRRRAELADIARTEPTAGRLGRAWRFFSLTVGHHRTLARIIRQEKHRHVLFSAYGEYFAPFWSGPLRSAALAGVTFGAIVHDPVRDARHGPTWWHRRAIAEAYSFLRHAYVHEAIELDTVRPVPGLRTSVLPHGPYRFKTTVPARAEARAQLSLPADAPVLLAFGHIRDGKNLDRVIEALVELPEVHLVVAGAALSSGQRPAAYYQTWAERNGVASRCRWHIRHISEEETGLFFAAADFVSLTYSRSFRSASGVLNAAVQFARPCLASSGASPLRGAVERYGLGVWVEPDDTAALVAGLQRLLIDGVQPRWEDYARENSWERNAEVVATSLFTAGA
jgi:glycosyltransferase involved in cell wall biosynthesis